MIRTTVAAHSGRHLRRATVAVAVVILALGAAACGDGPATGNDDPQPHAGSTTTYTNDAYGFSITHDSGLSQGEPVSDTGADFTIAFVDTRGPRAGETYVDGLQVSVFELPRAVKKSEVRGLKPQVEALVADRLAKLPSGEVTEPPARTTVNGTPGFTVSYAFTRDGVPVSAVSTFLFSGRYQYEVTGQANTADWEDRKPALEAATASFAVLSSS